MSTSPRCSQPFSEAEGAPLIQHSGSSNTAKSMVFSVPSMDDVVSFSHNDYDINEGTNNTFYNCSFVEEVRKEQPDQKFPVKSSLEMFHQGLLLLGTTLGYACAPIAIDWAMTVAVDEAGKPVKGVPFLPITVVFFSRITGGGLLFAAVLVKGISLKSVFTPKEILPWLPIGLGYALADLFEILACSNNKIDPATYIVLSQGRLMASALAMRVVMGTKQTALQWTIIVATVLTVVAWEWVPSEKGAVFEWDSKSPVRQGEWVSGVACTFIKMGLSVIMGIMCQRQFQGSEEVPFIVQMLRIESVCTLSAVFLVPINIWWFEWPHGIFGGKPVNGVPTGWGPKAVALVIFYVYYELVPALCVKRINVLAKSFCTAVSCIVTYTISVASRGIVPNPLKILLSVVLMLNIAQYGASKFEQAKRATLPKEKV